MLPPTIVDARSSESGEPYAASYAAPTNQRREPTGTSTARRSTISAALRVGDVSSPSAVDVVHSISRMRELGQDDGARRVGQRVRIDGARVVRARGAHAQDEREGERRDERATHRSGEDILGAVFSLRSRGPARRPTGSFAVSCPIRSRSCCALTLVALALGLTVMPRRAGALAAASDLVKEWTAGFGNAEILKFASQIMLIVVTGEAIAASPRRAAPSRASRRSHLRAQALLLVTTYALVTGWVHWGFGLVSSALLAREVARSCAARGVRVHYALLGTGAYTSMLLWHAGPHGERAAPDEHREELRQRRAGMPINAGAAKVPLSETVLAPYNLVACAVLLLLVPPLILAMHPQSDAAIVPADPAKLPDAQEATTDRRATVDPRGAPRSHAHPHVPGRRARADVPRALPARARIRLEPQRRQRTFLMLGLVLHRSPVAYARAIARASAASGASCCSSRSTAESWRS